MRGGLALLLSLAIATPAFAQEKVSRPGQYSGYSEKAYDGVQRTSFYVPVRDGTKLAVDLFRPTKDGVVASEKLPVVFMHTPYNRRTYRGRPAVEAYPGFAAELVPYGYNVAVVDYRGMYASYGKNRALGRGEWLEPARWDAYDVTEWFARQPWSNGKVGMWGCSATGTSQMQAATTRPPSLKAIFPISIEYDAIPLGGMTDQPPPRATPVGPERDRQAVPVDGPDGAKLLAEAVAQHDYSAETIGQVPFRDSVSPTLGEKWWLKSSNVTYRDELAKSGIGIYATGAWEEAGARRGAFDILNNVPTSKIAINFSGHCDWADVKRDDGFDIVVEERRWFDYWLKGIENGVTKEPRVLYWTYNAPRGQNWRNAASWPPAGSKHRAWYLGDGALSPTKPAAVSRATALTLPPARTNSVTVEAPKGPGVEYLTAPLTEDLELTGNPVVKLWISTPGHDADVLARLEDVAPDGTVVGDISQAAGGPQAVTHFMIGQLRLSNRKLAKAPYDNGGLPYHTYNRADVLPVPASQPVEAVFDLLPMSYVFKAGHRIRLKLTFGRPDGVTGSPVTVLSGGAQASEILLPVMATQR